MRVAFAGLLVLHGIAHLVGFLVPWGLVPTSEARSASLPVSNAILGGRLVLGDALARVVGVIWLVVGLAVVAAAIGFLRREPWALGAVVGSTLVSLALCAVWWPTTRVGLLVNVGVVAALLGTAYLAYRTEIRSERQRATFGSTIVATKYGPIEYKSTGTGPPILVVHGTGGGWDQGIYAARSIVPHGFRVIAPSRFGYLRTPMPADPSPQHEADVLAAFLDALEIERATVMSFSAGTAPAVQLALRHPERVSSLVLFVPAAAGTSRPHAKGPPPFVMNVVLHYDLPFWLAMRIAPNTVYEQVAAVPPALVRKLSVQDRATLDEGVRMILPVSSRSKGIMNDAKTQSGLEPLYPLERVSVPTLLLSAEDDLYRTLPVAREMARRIPSARLIAFKTGGHFLVGRANEVWPQVARFLRQEEARDALGRRDRPVAVGE
jgi:pimeloyl-ACP methyl ester carboxylesterase